MKDLCSRARAALNLLLILTLLQVWVLSPNDANSESVQVDVEQVESAFAGASQSCSEPGKAFDAEYRKSISFGGPETIPVTKILEIPEDAVSVAIELREYASEKAAPDTPDLQDFPRICLWGGSGSIDVPSTREDIDKTVDALRRLKNLTYTSGVVINTATIGEVEQKLAREIEVPFVKVKLNAGKASWILAIGVLAPFAFIYVVLDSLLLTLRAVPAGNEMDFLDFLPLYPSRSARVLGVIWLFAPIILTCVGLIKLLRGQSARLATVELLVPVALLWLFLLCLIKASAIRQDVKRLAMNSASTPEGEGGEEAEDDDEG